MRNRPKQNKTNTFDCTQLAPSLQTLKVSMLKQIVVDKVMARQLWKLGFKEPTLSYYDVNGQLQNAEGDT